MVDIAIAEYTGLRSDRFPFHPGFHGRLGQAVEYIGRQFDVAVLAIEFENVIGRGGLGVKSCDLHGQLDDDAKGGQ